VTRAVMLHFQSGAEALATQDLLDDPRFPVLHGMRSRIRALLAAPLRVDGRVVGLLAVAQSRPGRRWTEAQLDCSGRWRTNPARSWNGSAPARRSARAPCS